MSTIVSSGKPEAVRQRHRTHGLAIPLGIRHAEVAVRALLEVASLLVADEDDTSRPSSEPRPVTSAWSSAAAAVAMQLEEVVEDPLDVVERVRPLGVARELDRLPDLLGSRIGPKLVELLLQARELAGELRATQELHAAELTEPLAQPHFGLAGHQVRANSLRSRASVSRSSDRGTIASRWPNRRVRLREPEVVGKLLASRLGDDARPRERHERPGLGQHDVAEAREARQDSARRRMRENGDQRAARLVELVDGADRLRQLHESEDALLHARSSRCRDRDERRAGAGRALARPDELLSDDASHRAAHEGEVHDRELALLAADRRSATDHRVAETRLDLGLGQPLRVRTEIEEAQWIGGAQVARPPRRTIPDRRAARSARARERGSDVRTAGTLAASARARRRGSATRTAGHVFGCDSPFAGSSGRLLSTSTSTRPCPEDMRWILMRVGRAGLTPT